MRVLQDHDWRASAQELHNFNISSCVGEEPSFVIAETELRHSLFHSLTPYILTFVTALRSWTPVSGYPQVELNNSL